MSESNKKRLIVGLVTGGAAIAGAAIYYLCFRKGSQPIIPIDLPLQSSSEENKQFSKDARYYELVNGLKLSLEADVATPKLSKPALIDIHKVALHLAKLAYLQNYQDSRTRRKAKIGDLASYAEELVSCARKTEKLITEATEEVLRDLNLEKEFYMREDERVAQEEPNFQLLKLYLLESLRIQAWRKSQVKLTKSDVVDFYNYQLSLTEEFESPALKEHTADQILLCKQSYLNDRAALKFNMDEEDILLEPALFNDPEVRDLQKKLHLQLTLTNQSTASFPY